MSIEPVFPATFGEWLAWLPAFLLLLVGLWMFFSPRSFMRRFGLEAAPGRKDGVSEVRALFGGLCIGLPLTVLLLHPQPLLYLALGLAFLLAALGRFLAMLVDRDFSANNTGAFFLEAAGGVLPLLYALGIIS